MSTFHACVELFGDGQATINEKVAPELLDYDAPLVASIEAQIEHQVFKLSALLC